MAFTVDTPLQDAPLTPFQKRQLSIGTLRVPGNINTFSDLLLIPLPDFAKRCKISVPDAKAIYDKLLRECPLTELASLSHVEGELDDIFTTGDGVLDQALGGGVRTGMVWEICGESSAGKTQFALQLSLSVQLPPGLGGISGSTCYLITSAKLATGRLKQLSEHHPSFSASHSQGILGLQNVHTLSTSTVPILENILGNILPSFIQSKAYTQNPVKLVVIDALTELFHSAEKTTKSTIFTRSKDLNRIASSLHNIASTYNVAILVLNEVIDRFDRSEHQVFRPSPTPSKTPNDLVYSDKSRWFNTCNSIHGEDRKEASLGLVWANQLNVRIMLTRTGRRRYLHVPDPLAAERKRPKFSSPTQMTQAVISSDDAEQQATLVRRLSVIFSSVSPTISLDYVVMTEGVRVLADDMLLEELKGQFCTFSGDEAGPGPADTRTTGPGHQSTPPTQALQQPSESQAPPKATEDEDEWDRYWEAEEDISQHFDDFDALEMSLTQAQGHEVGVVNEDEEVPTSQPDEEL